MATAKRNAIKKVFRNFGPNPGAILEDGQFIGGVLVPFVYLASEYQLVFEKRSKNIRQPGEISFAGGEFDGQIDRTTRDTAIRETAEELGISPSRMTVYRRVGTFVTGRGISVDVYPGILRIRSLSELQPAKTEVEELFSVPFSHFLDNEPDRYSAHSELRSYYVDENGREVFTFPAKELGLPERYHRSWGKREHVLLVYQWQNHMIWGLTARIVHAFVQAFRRGT